MPPFPCTRGAVMSYYGLISYFCSLEKLLRPVRTGVSDMKIDVENQDLRGYSHNSAASWKYCTLRGILTPVNLGAGRIDGVG